MTDNERAHENSRSTDYKYDRHEKRMAKIIEFSFLLSTDRVKYTHPRVECFLLDKFGIKFCLGQLKI